MYKRFKVSAIALKQRGLDPLEETETALRQFMTTGQLPPLPTKISSGGRGVAASATVIFGKFNCGWSNM